MGARAGEGRRTPFHVLPFSGQGHLLSTAEVESALVEHEAVAEAAVVGHPHPVKGECLYCFVTLCDGHTFSPTLTEELKKQIREKIGPIATPDYIQNAPSLPKTRSGKFRVPQELGWAAAQWWQVCG